MTKIPQTINVARETNGTGSIKTPPSGILLVEGFLNRISMATREKQQALELIKPKVPSIKSRIVKALEKSSKGLTSKELVRYLGVKLNTVTGRLDELQATGDVQGIDLQGRAETKYYIVTDPELKRKLALNRSEQKFYSDLRKWKARYSDILSEKTFEWIEFEAKTNFKTRTHV